MESITPSRHYISERFPIASFNVHVPAQRHYEVVCATDPRLFHTQYAGYRSPANFYSSLSDGLIKADRGKNTWLLPVQQLRNFAGAKRIYYALGTYGGVHGEDPRFSISPDALEHVPGIELAPDFTGRTLDRSRFGNSVVVSEANYGGVNNEQARRNLRWGGDYVFEQEKELNEAQALLDEGAAFEYDDGYGGDLWAGSNQADEDEALLDAAYADDASYSMATEPSNDMSGTNAVLNTNEYEDAPAFYGYRVPSSTSVVHALGEPQVEDLEDEIQRIIAEGVDEAEVRQFVKELYDNSNIQTEPPASQALWSVHDIDFDSLKNKPVKINLPSTKKSYDGWKVKLIKAGIKLIAKLSPVSLLFRLIEKYNVTIAIGSSIGGGFGHGGSFGRGIFFAPGNIIGFYGSLSNLRGFVSSLSAGYQFTLINGGKEAFSGEAYLLSASVDVGDGPSIAIHDIFNNKGKNIGLTAEFSWSIGIPGVSAVEGFIQHQRTSTVSISLESAQSYSEPQPIAAYGNPTAAQALVNNLHYGKHNDYCEESFAESLPVGPAALPLGVQQLDIPEKVRILRVVARAESGDDAYSAIAADVEFKDPTHPAYQKYHIGLSWGLILFTQRGGALGKVLQKAKEREGLAIENLSEEQRFDKLFGEHWQELLNVTNADVTDNPNARVASVGEGPLWEEPWLTRFRNAGNVSYVQAAQNEVAVTDYFDKLLPVARWLGINTARGLAMMLDRIIHSGFGGGLSWIMRAAGPIKTDADRRIALKALTGQEEDLSVFQKQQGIPSDGQWNALTHAAMAGALRMLGENSPIAVMKPTQMLKAMVELAKDSPFEKRLADIYTNIVDFDESTSFDLE